MTLTLGATDIAIPTTGQHAGVTPQQAIAKGLWGMIYALTLTKRTATLYREYHYVGSRGFGKQAHTKKGTLTAASCAWMIYETSSGPVHQKLAEGYEAHWEILGYGWTKGQCLRIEAKLMSEALGRWGSRLLNKAQVDGGKLTTSNNSSKYSKRKKKVQPGVRFS